MDTYNLNDDVVKTMEEYFDIEYDNETKRFTTEDMLNFTIHAVIKLNKPAVKSSVCECKELEQMGELPVMKCYKCGKLSLEQTDL